MERKQILTRPIIILSLVSLFTDVASEMLYPVMPVYLRSIGFSIVLIGILEGLAEAVAGISKGYFGKLSDLSGKRVPFIRAGYSLSAVSKPLLAIFINPVWVFMCRTLDRFGKGIRTSARDAFLSDLSSRENKGRVFGFHRSMDTVGAAIGPLLALIYLEFYPEKYRWLFFIAFFPGLIAISLTYLIKDLKASKKVSSKHKYSFFAFLKYWKKAPLDYRLLVSGLLIFLVFNSSDVFLLLFLKARGYSDTGMIGFYIFYNMMYAIMSYPLGILSDKIGQKTVLIIGLLVFSGVYFLYGFAEGLVMFGLLFLFYALYAAATEGISKALISKQVNSEDTATAIGFYNSFASIAALTASSLGGLIWYEYSPRALFVFSGAGTFLTVLYLGYVFYRYRRYSRQ